VAQVQHVPGFQPQDETQHRADQRDRCRQGAFAQPVEVRADAGASQRHAKPEGEGRACQHPAHRADVRAWGQATRRRLGQEGAEHRVVAHGPHGQRGHDAQQTARIALLDEIAAHAVEAKA